MKDEQPFVIDDMIAQLSGGITINPGPALSSGLWFMATPYSLLPDLDLAADLAAQQAAFLITGGVKVFSPIVHGHAIFRAAARLAPGRRLGSSAADWVAVNAPIFQASTGLIVCQFSGWQDSAGIRAEVETAVRTGKTVVPMIPGVHPISGAMP